MSLPDERDASEPPDGLPDELPPVKPPSVVFILQLFAVPGLIVLSIVGVVSLFGTLATAKEDWWSLVETAAYYDNPWEVWAYRAQGNWPPANANPKLLWPIP